MQKKLKRELRKKLLNTKSISNSNLMNMANSWLTRFSNKHKHETKEEFQAWLDK